MEAAHTQEGLPQAHAAAWQPAEPAASFLRPKSVPAEHSPATATGALVGPLRPPGASGQNGPLISTMNEAAEQPFLLPAPSPSAATRETSMGAYIRQMESGAGPPLGALPATAPAWQPYNPALATDALQMEQAAWVQPGGGVGLQAVPLREQQWQQGVGAGSMSRPPPAARSSSLGGQAPTSLLDRMQLQFANSIGLAARRQVSAESAGAGKQGMAGPGVLAAGTVWPGQALSATSQGMAIPRLGTAAEVAVGNGVEGSSVGQPVSASLATANLDAARLSTPLPRLIVPDDDGSSHAVGAAAQPSSKSAAASLVRLACSPELHLSTHRALAGTGRRAVRWQCPAIIPALLSPTAERDDAAAPQDGGAELDVAMAQSMAAQAEKMLAPSGPPSQPGGGPLPAGAHNQYNLVGAVHADEPELDETAIAGLLDHVAHAANWLSTLISTPAAVAGAQPAAAATAAMSPSDLHQAVALFSSAAATALRMAVNLGKDRAVEEGAHHGSRSTLYAPSSAGGYSVGSQGPMSLEIEPRGMPSAGPPRGGRRDLMMHPQPIAKAPPLSVASPVRAAGYGGHPKRAAALAAEAVWRRAGLDPARLDDDVMDEGDYARSGLGARPHGLAISEPLVHDGGYGATRAHVNRRSVSPASSPAQKSHGSSYDSSKKMCAFPGCTRPKRRGRAKYCAEHGWGHPCAVPGCDAATVPNYFYQYCLLHGRESGNQEADGSDAPSYQAEAGPSAPSEQPSVDAEPTLAVNEFVNEATDDDHPAKRTRTADDTQLVLESPSEALTRKTRNTRTRARAAQAGYDTDDSNRDTMTTDSLEHTAGSTTGNERMCAAPGCSNSARSAGAKYCVKHAWGRRCTVPNCGKLGDILYHYEYCIAHGKAREDEQSQAAAVPVPPQAAAAASAPTPETGVRLCAVPGCGRHVRPGSQAFKYCFRHSNKGRKPCDHAGCSRMARVVVKTKQGKKRYCDHHARSHEHLGGMGESGASDSRYRWPDGRTTSFIAEDTSSSVVSSSRGASTPADSTRHEQEDDGTWSPSIPDGDTEPDVVGDDPLLADVQQKEGLSHGMSLRRDRRTGAQTMDGSQHNNVGAGGLWRVAV